MDRRGAAGLGVTVGELRALIAKLPATMRIVVRAPDGVHAAIWNAGVDTLDADSPEILALEVSDDPAFVKAEDERRT